MKKRIIIIAVIAVISEIIALSIVTGLFAHWLGKETVVSAGNSNPEHRDTQPGDKELTGDGDDISNIRAYIGFSDDLAIIKESIKIHCIKNTDDAVTHGKVYLYVPSLNITDTTINNIYLENEHLGPINAENWEINGLVLEIKVPNVDENPLETLNIHIEYEISLHKSDGIISQYNNQTLLTNFLITPAVYKGNKPIIPYPSSFGDPYIYESNNYHVTFNVSKDMTIYAPGVKEIVSGDIVFRADNIRDFPAVIIKDNDKEKSSSRNDIHVEKINNTEICFINAADAVEYVLESFLFASENIGTYPYRKFFIVRVPMALRGMEFSNMIFLSDDCFINEEELKRVAYHEVLHQWFYGIIGTDQINEPFMDEGIVNYLAIMLSGGKLSNNYSDEFFIKELGEYPSTNEYYRLVYTDAAIYFSNIHNNLGKEFYELLKLIYNNEKYKILYFDKFKQYLTDFYARGGKNFE